MASKRVLHLYSSWTAGGAEKVMLELACGLERNGLHNVIAAPGDSFLYEQARKAGLAVRPIVIKGSFDPFGLWRLAGIVRRERIDIIHAHQGKVFWPCVIMKLLSGGRLRIVFHRHAQLPHRFYSRSHYRWADRIIAISSAVADCLVERDKVDRARIRVVYNGTDFDRFHPGISGREVRDRYGLGDSPVIGTVAAMNAPRGKGQEYLIRAAKLLESEFPRAKYLIVGKGEILEDLKKTARDLGLEKRVIFAGYQDRVEDFMAAMDVVCLLSWDTEGFGQVIVEAQAMGKPVVGTSVGGIPEAFADGKTGFLIPPEDPEALSSALRPLLTDEALRARMGSAAAGFVRGRFGMDDMAKTTADIYGSMFSERPASGEDIVYERP